MTRLARGKKLTNCLRVTLLGITFMTLSSSSSESFASPPNKFNQLILAKSSLESKFGVRFVECFPFKENIGFTEGQIKLIEQCLAGVQLFESALNKVPNSVIHSLGISTRFLRTGGFSTILIPWDSSLEKVMSFLRAKVSKENRSVFLRKYQFSNVK